MLQSAAIVPSTEPVDLHAAVLQGVLTVLVALGGFYTYRRYRKPYLGWFAVTMSLYAARMGVIAGFLATGSPRWLYWHQVATGWTALALLWTSLTFARQPRFRNTYLAALIFPVAWSYIAIYQVDSFLAAALPAVLFLSGVTAGTAWVFNRYATLARSSTARFLAITLALWALHHLDYPFLRARGVWSPWGYYVDILFVLATTAGLAALVLEDLARGVNALVALAPSTRPVSSTVSDDLGVLLGEALKLPAALGSAIARVEDNEVTLVRAVGALEGWQGGSLPERAAKDIAATIERGRPLVVHDWPHGEPGTTKFAFGALLPITLEHAAPAALLLVGEARHPFAALDDRFLAALGNQIGGVLQSHALVERLRTRTEELARLSARTIGQIEEERRRLSLELHDETAQVFAAVKLRLGLLRERVDSEMQEQVGQVVDLVDTGMRSIRGVTETLRPRVLDELGVAAAIRSLAADFAQRTSVRTSVHIDGDLHLAPNAELALYRGVQESLANVARHTGASRVRIDVTRQNGSVRVTIGDDGRGFPGGMDDDRLVFNGHTGLAGMRERALALGGSLTLGRAADGGAQVSLELPAP